MRHVALGCVGVAVQPVARGRGTVGLEVCKTRHLIALLELLALTSMSRVKKPLMSLAVLCGSNMPLVAMPSHDSLVIGSEWTPPSFLYRSRISFISSYMRSPSGLRPCGASGPL